MSLRPVYCAHKAARPPRGKRRDAEGRVLLVTTLPSAVVTVPWCPSDHRPEK